MLAPGKWAWLLVQKCWIFRTLGSLEVLLGWNWESFGYLSRKAGVCMIWKEDVHFHLQPNRWRDSTVSAVQMRPTLERLEHSCASIFDVSWVFSVPARRRFPAYQVFNPEKAAHIKWQILALAIPLAHEKQNAKQVRWTRSWTPKNSNTQFIVKAANSFLLIRSEWGFAPDSKPSTFKP